MVVTTVVFVAGVGLLTDGALATSPHLGRHSAGMTWLSDSDTNLITSVLLRVHKQNALALLWSKHQGKDSAALPFSSWFAL